MRELFNGASWLLGFLALGLLVVAILATPTQALADGGGPGQNPPCLQQLSGVLLAIGGQFRTCQVFFLGGGLDRV